MDFYNFLKFRYTTSYQVFIGTAGKYILIYRFKQG